MFLKRYDIFGEISNRLPNGLFGANLYKTLESCWWSLLTILQWTNTTCGRFSFVFLVILFSVLQSNFIVSGVKSSRWYSVLMISYFQFYLDIFTLMDYQSFHYVFLKYTQNNLEYLIQSMTHLAIPCWTHFGADILNLLLLHELFMFSMCDKY